MAPASGTIARARELLFAFAAGLVLAIVMTWPLATDLAHLGRTRSTDGDGQFSIWNVAWVARTLVVDPIHVFDANIYHPHKLTLAYSEANLLTGALGIPAYWISRNPWLTLNVVFLFGFASAYAAAYMLLRHLSGDRHAAAVGGILYAFCPYVFSHLSHIQLLMTGGLPWAMLMLHRLADSAAPASLPAAAGNPAEAGSHDTARSQRGLVGRGVWLGVALAAQALSCAYYGIFGGLMVGYAALLLAATRRLWRSSAYWKGIAAAAATVLAIVVPVFVPFLRVQAESGFRRTVEDTARWAATPHGYLVSSANAHRPLLEFARQFGPWTEVLFPGILAVILGVAGLFIAATATTVTTAGTAAAKRGRDRETALLYGTLGLLAFWSSFGPAAGLYRVLYYLPAFSFLRAPSRLGLVVVLCLAVLSAFALRTLLAAAGRRRTLVAGAAIVAAIADLAIVPLRWYRAPEIPGGYAALAAAPRAPLAEFPFYGERIAFPLHTQYMLFSTAHWLPMVNGYSDVIPADFRQAAPVLDTFPSADAFAVLARRRVRYVTIHWDMFGPRAADIRQRLQRYLPNLRVMADDPRMSVYEVLRYP